MFFKSKKRELTGRRKEAYDRVYSLHQQAEFLCYINDAYMETIDGQTSVKLEGLVAMGTGNLGDVFELYDCEGNKKAEITMDELYLGANSVERLEGGDKRVALYPKEQDVVYKAGDILIRLPLKKETDEHTLPREGE